MPAQQHSSAAATSIVQPSPRSDTFSYLCKNCKMKLELTEWRLRVTCTCGHFICGELSCDHQSTLKKSLSNHLVATHLPSSMLNQCSNCKGPKPRKIGKDQLCPQCSILRCNFKYCMYESDTKQGLRIHSHIVSTQPQGHRSSTPSTQHSQVTNLVYHCESCATDIRVQEWRLKVVCSCGHMICGDETCDHQTGTKHTFNKHLAKKHYPFTSLDQCSNCRAVKKREFGNILQCAVCSIYWCSEVTCTFESDIRRGIVRHRIHIPAPH